MSLFCSECGATLASGSKFCNKCGTKVVNDIEAPLLGFKEVLPPTPPSSTSVPLVTASIIQESNASPTQASKITRTAAVSSAVTTAPAPNLKDMDIEELMAHAVKTRKNIKHPKYAGLEIQHYCGGKVVCTYSMKGNMVRLLVELVKNSEIDIVIAMAITHSQNPDWWAEAIEWALVYGCDGKKDPHDGNKYFANDADQRVHEACKLQEPQCMFARHLMLMLPTGIVSKGKNMVESAEEKADLTGRNVPHPFYANILCMPGGMSRPAEGYTWVVPNQHVVYDYRVKRAESTPTCGGSGSGGSADRGTFKHGCLKWLANTFLFNAIGFLLFGYLYGPCTSYTCYDESGEIPCASCTLDYQLVCCPGSCSLLNNCNVVTGLAAQLDYIRNIGWAFFGIFIALKLYITCHYN
jgi:hypothetical protein